MAEFDPGYDDVRIRDVEDADLAVFFRHQHDPQATRMAEFAAKARQPFRDYWAEIRTDPSIIAQTILVNGAVAGNLTCWHSREDARSATGSAVVIGGAAWRPPRSPCSCAG